MLRQLGLWASSYFSSPPPEKPAAESKEEPQSFSAILKNIGHDEDKIPLYFLCPISCALMEDPVYVNQLQTHTFDRECLNKSLENSPHFDPFQTKIESVGDNAERKKQIQDFVSLLIVIDMREKELYANECFYSQANLSNEEEIKLIKQKINLLAANERFIKFVTNIIDIEDKHRELREKETEINKICHDKIILVSELKAELDEVKNIHPMLFCEPSYLSFNIFVKPWDKIKNNTEGAELFRSYRSSHE